MPETPTIPQATDRPTRLTLPPFDGAAGSVYPVFKPGTDLRGRQTLPPFFMSPVRQGGPLPGAAQAPQAEQSVATGATSEPEPAEPWAASPEGPTSVLVAPVALGDAVPDEPLAFAPPEFAPEIVDAEFAPSDFAPPDATEVDDGSSIYDVPQFERLYEPAVLEREAGTMALTGPDGREPADAMTAMPLAETEADPIEDLHRVASPVSWPGSPESVVALLVAPVAPPADPHEDPSNASLAEASATAPLFQDAVDDTHFVDPEYELQPPHAAPDVGYAVSAPADPFVEFTPQHGGRGASLPPTVFAGGTHEAELPSDDIADLFADPDFAAPPALEPHTNPARRAAQVTPVLDASRIPSAPPIGSGHQTASRTTRRRPTPVLGSQAITPLATRVIRQTPMAGTMTTVGARVPLESRGASAISTTVMSSTPIAVPALANMSGSRTVAQALEMVAARIRAGELVVAGDVPVGHDPIALASALAAALAALLGVRH